LLIRRGTGPQPGSVNGIDPRSTPGCAS